MIQWLEWSHVALSQQKNTDTASEPTEHPPTQGTIKQSARKVLMYWLEVSRVWYPTIRRFNWVEAKPQYTKIYRAQPIVMREVYGHHSETLEKKASK